MARGVTESPEAVWTPAVRSQTIRARRWCGAAVLLAIVCGTVKAQERPGLSLVRPPEPTAQFSADIIHHEEVSRHTLALGNVRLTYRNYVLTGDSGDLDEDAQVATVRGNVSLDTGREVLKSSPEGVVVLNLRTRAWTFTRAITEITPSGALAPFHVSAESLSGTRREITLHHVRLTSCDPAHPSYEIVAREATILPDRKVVARRASTYLFGRRLLTLPVVTVPVRKEGEQSPVVPVVGQSTEEGMYLKTSVNYASGRNQTGALKVDLLQKQGLGLGVVHDYAPNDRGQVSLYTVRGQAGSNLTANLHDRYSILGFQTQVTGELRRNSYTYVSGTTSRNGGVTMTRAVDASKTTISLNYNGSATSGTSYRSLVTGFAQEYRFSSKGAVQLSLDHSRQSSEGAAATEDFSRKVALSQGLGVVDLSLDANRITSHTGSDSSSLYLPVQRLPEFSLKTDAYRLGLSESRSAPLALSLATGSFKANGVRSDRQLFEATAPSRRWKEGSTSLSLSGGFRQAVYSSDAALYSMNGGLSATQPLGRKSDFTLAYSVSKSKGYTPFQFDRPFAYESLSGSVKVADMRGLELRGGTAYDFRNNLTPWRDALMTAILQPRAGIRLVTVVAMNINGRQGADVSKVRYVNNAARLRLGRFHFDGEGRYTPTTGRFGRLLGTMDTPMGRDWRLRALAGTDSGQHYRHFLAVKDMGCLEASLGFVDDHGWRNETGIRVLLRIKAFPVADPFTTGMFGENLNIGGGDITGGTREAAPAGAPGF